MVAYSSLMISRFPWLWFGQFHVSSLTATDSGLSYKNRSTGLDEHAVEV